MQLRILIPVAVFAVGLLAALAWMGARRPPDEIPQAVLPKRTSGGFVSSDACRDCHADEHASWHRSYHRTMTQEASPQTVLAPFEGVTLNTAGQEATLSRRGDEFWVRFVDPAWEQARFAQWSATKDEEGAADPFAEGTEAPKRDAQVVLTTGSHHFQVYWVRGPRGRELWQFPWRYHIPTKRWMHRKDVFLAPPEWRPGMWFRVWNDSCSLCHSTGPLPGEDPATGVLAHTQVVEFGIACESCHGPAADHVAFHRSEQEGEDPIVNPARLSHRRGSEVCGACHSHFRHTDPDLRVHGAQYRPGKNLNHFGALEDPPSEPQTMSRFWADGANRSGGREFSGLSQSACYLDGELSCMHCHSMHKSDPNDQLIQFAHANDACLDCHGELGQDLTSHTHHAPDSAGSQCVNCHMPHTNFALLKAIRSHTIDSPVVTSLASNTRPNACNLCHLDQTLAWTAGHLADWYGAEVPELTESERSVAAGSLWALRGDAGQRVITAWHFGWPAARQAAGSDWMGPMLAELLRDPYAAVRFVAAEALAAVAPALLPPDYDFDGLSEHHQQSAERVLEAWAQEVRGARSPERLRQLLLDAQGNAHQQRIRELLGERDNRLVAGVE